MLLRLALIIVLGFCLQSIFQKIRLPGLLGMQIAGVTLLGPLLLHMTVLESAILGTILGAVSPAIAVPKMLHLQESGYGKNHSIPQMIMAGASVSCSSWASRSAWSAWKSRSAICCLFLPCLR